ncbi:hypothetical protein O3M35_008851 [Rhynocoris fuscipes]|uniref:Uncharacterized protein n=1 Tax=Rhynocoris fuscipes TaxID=488301 RepID=A0AAW1DCZ1_9HEMI
MRVKDGRWTKTIMCWCLDSLKRKVGRQKKRWVDDIIQHAGISWKKFTGNKQKWLTMGEGERGLTSGPGFKNIFSIKAINCYYCLKKKKKKKKRKKNCIIL